MRFFKWLRKILTGHDWSPAPPPLPPYKVYLVLTGSMQQFKYYCSLFKFKQTQRGYEDAEGNRFVYISSIEKARGYDKRVTYWWLIGEYFVNPVYKHYRSVYKEMYPVYYHPSRHDELCSCVDCQPQSQNIYDLIKARIKHPEVPHMVVTSSSPGDSWVKRMWEDAKDWTHENIHIS